MRKKYLSNDTNLHIKIRCYTTSTLYIDGATKHNMYTVQQKKTFPTTTNNVEPQKPNVVWQYIASKSC